LRDGEVFQHPISEGNSNYYGLKANYSQRNLV